jgi:UDP-N-acetylmuramate--alanine ligase
MKTEQFNRIYKRLQQALADPKEPYLVQSIEEQALFVCRKVDVVERYDSSSSRFGIGSRENSFRTPIGLHRIKEKIGAGAPAGRIFRDREYTGEDWDGVFTEDNLITTRILWLEGLEEGINSGPGIDTYGRYIYIHGTGREDMVGTPLSHGCL